MYICQRYLVEYTGSSNFNDFKIPDTFGSAIQFEHSPNATKIDIEFSYTSCVYCNIQNYECDSVSQITDVLKAIYDQNLDIEEYQNYMVKIRGNFNLSETVKHNSFKISWCYDSNFKKVIFDFLKKTNNHAIIHCISCNKDAEEYLKKIITECIIDANNFVFNYFIRDY